MRTASLTSGSLQQQAVRWTLSVPVQATLFTSLCALTLWTVYFSSYPAAHNQMHSLRHHTLSVSCH
ncbi:MULTISPECIES: CbtB-domain containing protein [Trichocoleus]|uniref:CbtB-domain containing protein n=1 Tax=Trichocoleus desertorum GB2-A4 TaxID=2933944 RepID=A0ABV0JA48_9CYAN|nr:MULTISPECIES: CbtB-domain containing protein [unclassified Trichocoleus]MBD1862258.1 CbtB-domain containing protein [Trichocoleus sp. FACHB-46]MBD2096866.1 CbtB-domain containing protein [Trichocoleus sp. FACHB-591]MBD2122070.1 CbtB-domain containing protein [Trichocoleus sp. FACHB-262]